MSRETEKLLDQFEDWAIEEVRDEGKYYSIRTNEGWWLSLDKGKCAAAPVVGQTARFYGRGIGSPVRGVDLDGVEVYYQTEDEYRAASVLEAEVRNSARRAEADASRTARDAAVAALPDCFQKRIARFRRNNPDFYWEHEPYEMASCVDAVKIAEALRSKGDPKETLTAFRDLGWEEQKAVVPDLDSGHSGNTFGMAVRLAYLYLTDERLVFAEHAAISALVGCEEAGCPPVTDAELIEAGYAPFQP